MTSERATWEELRREIEALPNSSPYPMDPRHGLVDRRAVLAIVDRLAAARGEPPEEAESLLVEAMTRGWISPGTRSNQPDDPWLVWQLRYANLRLATPPPEPAIDVERRVVAPGSSVVLDAEIARLRRIEAAARAMDLTPGQAVTERDAIANLRAALATPATPEPDQ